MALRSVGADLGLNQVTDLFERPGLRQGAVGQIQRPVPEPAGGQRVIDQPRPTVFAAAAGWDLGAVAEASILEAILEVDLLHEPWKFLSVSHLAHTTAAGVRESNRESNGRRGRHLFGCDTDAGGGLYRSCGWR